MTVFIKNFGNGFVCFTATNTEHDLQTMDLKKDRAIEKFKNGASGIGIPLESINWIDKTKDLSESKK